MLARSAYEILQRVEYEVRMVDGTKARSAVGNLSQAKQRPEGQRAGSCLFYGWVLLLLTEMIYDQADGEAE